MLMHAEESVLGAITEILNCYNYLGYDYLISYQHSLKITRSLLVSPKGPGYFLLLKLTGGWGVVTFGSSDMENLEMTSKAFSGNLRSLLFLTNCRALPRT